MTTRQPDSSRRALALLPAARIEPQFTDGLQAKPYLLFKRSYDYYYYYYYYSEWFFLVLLQTLVLWVNRVNRGPATGPLGPIMAEHICFVTMQRKMNCPGSPAKSGSALPGPSHPSSPSVPSCLGAVPS